MKKIILNVKRANEDIMKKLEKLGVIERLIPPLDLLDINEGEVRIRKIYSSDNKYGGHMLLFVNMNDTKSELNYHPDNEEVFLFNPSEIKPLIFIFANENYLKIEEKIKREELRDNDFTAVEIPFNNPNLSFFTVNKAFPHYEITIPGSKRSPSFWVTESNELPMIILDLKNYNIIVNYK